MLRNGEVIQAETSGARTVSLASYDPSSSQRVLTLSIERGIGRRAELDSGIYQCLANSSIGSGHSAKGVVILSGKAGYDPTLRSSCVLTSCAFV